MSWGDLLVFGQAFDLKRRRISQTIEIRHDLINIVVGGGHVTTSPTRCEGEEQKQTKDDKFLHNGRRNDVLCFWSRGDRGWLVGASRDGAPIINGWCGTRHFGELAAVARTTDEEEAANEDKTIIEAIHNTKVGVRHEMAQAKRSVFPNVHILHSRSWRNWGFRRFSHEKTAHTGQFCAVK